MKRYTLKKTLFMGGISDAHMEPADDGEFYSRADLIAAGVLVPVPDGEALPFLDFVNISGGYHIMHDGRVLHVSGPCVFDERGHVDAAVCMDTIVQPVRLVKLEDLGC